MLTFDEQSFLPNFFRKLIENQKLEPSTLLNRVCLIPTAYKRVHGKLFQRALIERIKNSHRLQRCLSGDETIEVLDKSSSESKALMNQK